MSALRLPTLSVIMPNYNHGQYLGEALHAILNQSVRPIEVLVFDDASTDDSVRIVTEIAQRDPVVRLIVNTRNVGPIPNINRGLHEAKGEFVLTTASDDQVLPGLIEESMSLLAQNPQARLCAVDLAQFDAVTGRTRFLRPNLSKYAGYINPGALKRKMAGQHVHMYGGMTILSRTAALEVGGFLPDLKWYSDWFSILILSLRYGACYVPEALATMRVLPNSYSASGSKSASTQEILFKRIFDLLQSDKYFDVLAPIQESASLCVLGARILPVLLTDPKYRDLVSARLLMRLLANIPVTLAGLNPATPSPLRFLDRAVRNALGLDGFIQTYGIELPQHPTD